MAGGRGASRAVARRAAIAVVAAWLPAAAALSTPSALARGAPRSFGGSLKIVYRLSPINSAGVSSSGGGSFEGSYSLRGRPWHAKGAPRASYLLSGTGHEHLAIARTDVAQPEGSRSRFELRASADGAVRLGIRGHPREAGSLVLQLLPKGRFTLALTGLEGGGEGLPLSFGMTRDDTQVCVPPPGSRHGVSSYGAGVYQADELERCPGEEPASPRRQGSTHAQSIWGMSVWATLLVTGDRPDLCHGRAGLMLNRYICGRMTGRGIRGHEQIDLVLAGACPFEPLVDPIQDPVGEACTIMPIGSPEWRATLVLSWDLVAHP